MTVLRGILTKGNKHRSPQTSELTNKDFYMFVLENGMFVTYITDSSGNHWSKVTRWIIEGLNSSKIKVNNISVRPFSVIEVVATPKILELKYIFTNILYGKGYSSNNTHSGATYEVFNNYSKGSLSLSLRIPVESILSNAFILGENDGEPSVISLGKDIINKIVDSL